MNSSQIDITEEHRQQIKEILSKHLPTTALVWVFGSRVKGTARKYSDLDLAIKADAPLPSSALTNLKFELEESNLPYKVDVIDWNTISDAFKQHIEQDKVLL